MPTQPTQPSSAADQPQPAQARPEQQKHSNFCDCADCCPECQISRPYFTWRCEACGAEFDALTYGGLDALTYGGPCIEERCTGELRRRKTRP